MEKWQYLTKYEPKEKDLAQLSHLKRNVSSQLKSLQSMLSLHELETNRTTNPETVSPKRRDPEPLRDRFEDWTTASKSLSSFNFPTRNLFRDNKNFPTEEPISPRPQSPTIVDTKLDQAETHMNNFESRLERNRDNLDDLRRSTRLNWEKIAKEQEAMVHRLKRQVMEKENEIIRLRQELTKALQTTLESENALSRRTEAAVERNQELQSLLESSHANNKVLLSQNIAQRQAMEELKDIWKAQFQSEIELKNELRQQIQSLTERVSTEKDSRDGLKELLYETLRNFNTPPPVPPVQVRPVQATYAAESFIDPVEEKPSLLMRRVSFNTTSELQSPVSPEESIAECPSEVSSQVDSIASSSISKRLVKKKKVVKKKKPAAASPKKSPVKRKTSTTSSIGSMIWK